MILSIIFILLIAALLYGAYYFYNNVINNSSDDNQTTETNKNLKILVNQMITHQMIKKVQKKYQRLMYLVVTSIKVI